MRRLFRDNEFFYRPEQGNTSLILAAGDSDVKAVRQLIADGLNVSASNVHKQTALHWAVDLGFDYPEETTQIVDLLLDHGADINAQDNRGATALVLAAFRKSNPIVRQLLARGADPNLLIDDSSPEGATLISVIEGTPSLRPGTKRLIKMLEEAGGIRNK